MGTFFKLFLFAAASFSGFTFGSDASFASYNCQTTNNIHLMGPADGVAHAVYFSFDHNGPLPPSPIHQVLLCRRACGKGAYVFVIDNHEQYSPAYEVVSEKTDEKGYIQVVLNTTETNGKFDANIKGGNIQLVLLDSAYNYPAKLWYYQQTKYSLANGKKPELLNTLSKILGTWWNAACFAPAPAPIVPCPVPTPCVKCGPTPCAGR